MTARRVEPIVWLLFSGGGVVAAVLLPVVAVLSALVFPLGWVSPPEHDHLVAVLGHPVTFVVLLGAVVLLLVHSAHRFRYALYDGLLIKRQRLVAVLCYGAAVVGSLAAVAVLWSVG